MKKSFRRIIALVLAVITVIALLGLCSCSNTGDTMMSLGNQKITENMFVFWLSRQKASFEYSYASSIKSELGVSSIDAFWNLRISEDSTKTYGEKFTEDVLENAKTFLVALYLFDEFDLKLSDETKKDIEDTIEEMKEELADGSKNEFNVLLAEYGLNMDTLKACYEISEKVSVLKEYLLSSNGPITLSDSSIEAYYQKTYVRMEQICIYLDQHPVMDSSGNYVLDTDGNVSYKDYSKTEIQLQRDKADAALAALNLGTDFSDVAANYNENVESDDYTNGIYISSDNAYASGADATTIYETLVDMKDGEYKLIELEHTLHIVRKLPLEAKAYNNSANTDFFTFYDSSVGNYVQFTEYVKTPLFLEYIASKLEELKDKIKVNEDVKNRNTIATVKANNLF